MPWAKLDDRMHRRRKIRGLSDAAWRLYVSVILDCCAEQSDGEIEGWTLRELLPHHHEEHVRELISRGLLHDAPGCDSPTCLGSQGLPVAGDLFVVHDFAQWQISANGWSAMKDGAQLANHKRWHEERGVKNPKCRFCYPHLSPPDSPPDSGDDSPPGS